MADDTKKILQTQLWNIANTLRGKMGADEFRDYILGFIFYKYLSERMHLFADEILKHDGITFAEIKETTSDGKAYLQAIEKESVERLGYFLKPSELFHKIAEKGARTYPGAAGDDFRPFFRVLREAGYQGVINIEGTGEDDQIAAAFKEIARQAAGA